MTVVPAALCVFFPMVPCFLDPLARQLAEDAGLALDRAGYSRQAAAIDAGVPLNKLSDQLNGKAPFTTLWRLLVGLDADFRHELFAIQSERGGAMLLRQTDLQRLVRSVEAWSGRRRMVKADLPSEREERRA